MYKRQAFIAAPKALKSYFGTGLFAIVIHPLTSVSYTHLDVYKRQFHTSLLKEASLALKERFKKETFNEMKIPVIFNTLGHEIEYQSIPEILEKQVMSPVYFEKSIRYMIDQGVDTIIEVGPGKVLSGFVRKIDRSIDRKSVV